MRDSHTPQALKVQIALMGVLCLLVLFAPWSAWVRWTMLVLLALFGLSALSFVRHVARRDLSLLPIALCLLAVRSLALGTGLVLGALRFTLRPQARGALGGTQGDR